MEKSRMSTDRIVRAVDAKRFNRCGPSTFMHTPRSASAVGARTEWHRRYRTEGLLTRISIFVCWNTTSPVRVNTPLGARIVGSVG
jgi:hypothetical protein